MTPSPATDCAHERRPGTTVCLYCRAEERAVVSRRRKRAALKLLAISGGCAAVVMASAAALSAFRGGSDAGVIPAAAADAPPTSAEGPGVEQAGAARRRATTPAGAPARRATGPVVPQGRTMLSNGIFAERTGDTVVVNFDTQGLRTRRSDKFENTLRETLPAVLGEAGTKALEQVAPGTLVPPGQLVASTGADPLRLPVGDGRTVKVKPGSRMGQDGPLVVTYQVVVDPSTPSPTS